MSNVSGWNTGSIGTSVGGLPIEIWKRGNGKLRVLLLGGVHGDESEGVFFAEKLIRETGAGRIQLPESIELAVIPGLNPDGVKKNRRTNSHNVDLNRNMPTADWSGDFSNVRYYPGSAPGSEPETQALVSFLADWDPGFILSLHSYENAMVNFNGESEDLARAMSEKNGLPPKGDIGYPTPGSLGTYAGWERNLPTITLEILRGQKPKAVWDTHIEGVISALAFYLEHPLPNRKQI